MKEFLTIIVTGDSVGKTSLINQFVGHEIPSSYRPTIGADFVIKKTATTPLQIWDTAGQERYDALPSSFYRSADVFILVYSAIKRDSFTNAIGKRFKEIRKICSKTPIVLVELDGEQCDLGNDLHVTKSEGEANAKKIKAEFRECSLQNLVRVNELFKTAVQMYFAQEESSSQATLTPARLITQHSSCLYDSSSTGVDPVSPSEATSGESFSFLA